MADWLLLRLPRSPGESASWLIAAADGAPLAAPDSGPLAAAAPAAAGRRVCVLVPGADVLFAEPEVPAKAGAKLAQLVPYALEEHLADDIEELHFAVGRRAADSPRVPVAVVARALMSEWLAALAAAGIVPESLYADSELLPSNPGQAVVLLEEDAVAVRPPDALPVSLPADALSEALETAHSASQAIASHVAVAGAEGAPALEAGAPRGLIVYAGASEWERHSAAVEAARGLFEGVSVQLLTGGPLTLFAQQLPGANAINLLQGRYAPTSSRAVGLVAWRTAAILLLGLLVLHVGGKAAELRVLSSREHQVDASIRDAFRSAMPGQPGALDARRRMEQRLQAVRGSGGANGLLAALEALARSREAAPGTQVKSLNFHDGRLELTLSAPDAASLDRLGQQLRGRGWQAELIGGNNVGNSYEGRVQIRAQGT
ncbi:MAG TPA: type II secretion system protein GspL [Steroidobacteraceae bacterium]|nr:type II secretion system protein GspL [Steroidobacteraceae bacterium]